MSVVRVLLAAMFGALAGGGSAVALMQSGQLEPSTNTVAILAGVAAGVSALLAALARFRVIKMILILGVIALSIVTLVMAQTADASALAAEAESCATARIDGKEVPSTPGVGQAGSRQKPVRIAADKERSLVVGIGTLQPFDDATVVLTIDGDLPTESTFELPPDKVKFEDGWAVGQVEIVDSFLGLSLKIGNSKPVPLPVGTVLLTGTISDLSGRNGNPDCSFAVHIVFESNAQDTLVGLLALGAVAVGGLGLIVIALTAGSASSGGATGAPTPTEPVPPSPPQPGPPRPTPAPPTMPPAPGPPVGSPAPPPVSPGSVAVTVPNVVGAGGTDSEETRERFVQMRIEADGFPEQGFVAGTTNNLSFWIGPEVLNVYVAQASHAVAEVGRTVTLDAQFVWSNGEATATMTLDADPSTRSDPKFDVAVEIPADVSRFAGTLYLWVRETNRLYEQVKVVGTTGGAGHTNHPHLISIIEDREQIERITNQSTAVGACVVHQGNSLFWYTNAQPAIHDATDVMAVQASLSSAVANLQARSGRLDWTDPTALQLLRSIAVEGAKLRYSVAGEIEPGNALQFYNQQDKTTVPFEWVYDRGYTAPGAQVKSVCIESLRYAGVTNRSPNDPFPCGCPPASALGPDVLFSNATLCPWGFWGLSKVIERYDTEPTLVNNVPHPGEDEKLPSFSSVLLAANHTLDLPSGRPGEVPVDLATELGQTAHTYRVSTWQDFRTQLGASNAHLAVTLPHQELDTLQIGTDPLHLSQVPTLLAEGHDRVILLLGCKTTQAASEGFASFGRVFKDHAAVVIGSSAVLVTSDAARLAVELVQQLAKVAATGEPLGNAVVAARRSLFADGYPIALAVTALGDADWRFASRPLAPA